MKGRVNCSTVGMVDIAVISSSLVLLASRKPNYKGWISH
jgi:hypothetical protein